MYQRKTQPKNDCSIEKTLNAISGKWKPVILFILLKTDARLRDFQREIPEASKRALTQQLSELIVGGLIRKKSFDEFPKRTEYSLTYLGTQLSHVFTALTKFGDKL